MHTHWSHSLSIINDVNPTSEDIKLHIIIIIISSLIHWRRLLCVYVDTVGFSARFNQDGGQYVGVALGQHTTLIFDDVITNTGGAYDPNTGTSTERDG